MSTIYALAHVTCPTCPRCPGARHSIHVSEHGRVYVDRDFPRVTPVTATATRWHPTPSSTGRTRLRAWSPAAVRAWHDRWQIEVTLAVEATASESEWLRDAAALPHGDHNGLISQVELWQGRPWLALTGLGSGVLIDLGDDHTGALLAALASAPTLSIVEVGPTWDPHTDDAPRGDETTLAGGLMTPLPRTATRDLARRWHEGTTVDVDPLIARDRIRAETLLRPLLRRAVPAPAPDLGMGTRVVSISHGWWDRARTCVLTLPESTTYAQLAATAVDVLNLHGEVTPALPRKGAPSRELRRFVGDGPRALHPAEHVEVQDVIAVLLNNDAPAVVRDLGRIPLHHTSNQPELLCAPLSTDLHQHHDLDTSHLLRVHQPAA